jgi:hypothetical protein
MIRLSDGQVQAVSAVLLSKVWIPYGNYPDGVLFEKKPGKHCFPGFVDEVCV